VNVARLDRLALLAVRDDRGQSPELRLEAHRELERRRTAVPLTRVEWARLEGLR
jgi:hypothetical protein